MPPVWWLDEFLSVPPRSRVCPYWVYERLGPDLPILRFEFRLRHLCFSGFLLMIPRIPTVLVCIGGTSFCMVSCQAWASLNKVQFVEEGHYQFWLLQHFSVCSKQCIPSLSSRSWQSCHCRSFCPFGSSIIYFTFRINFSVGSPCFYNFERVVSYFIELDSPDCGRQFFSRPTLFIVDRIGYGLDYIQLLPALISIHENLVKVVSKIYEQCSTK